PVTGVAGASGGGASPFLGSADTTSAWPGGGPAGEAARTAAGSCVAAAAVSIGAGEECLPTIYPMLKKIANSTTTMKNPLSNCLLPSTSSNSPSSFLGIYG